VLLAPCSLLFALLYGEYDRIHSVGRGRGRFGGGRGGPGGRGGTNLLNGVDVSNPIMLSLVLNGTLCVPVVTSCISFSSVNTWQAMVDAVDEEEEMDMEHQVDVQLEPFNNTKAMGMLPLSRGLESVDISMVLDLAEVRTKDMAVDMAVVLRLSRVDSQGHW
jgi:hypothetical protein